MFQEWIDAKHAEAEAIRVRREIEDALTAKYSISEDLEGTESREEDGYKIKIVGRINRKVDSELLQSLAREAGLSDHLSRLFRWKPEINANAWKATNEEITNPLLGAITSAPGRPSFTITKEE
jgi:hypothetical protein